MPIYKQIFLHYSLILMIAETCTYVQKLLYEFSKTWPDICRPPLISPLPLLTLHSAADV